MISVGLMSGIVWAVFIFAAVALGFTGSRFSVRTLRLFTCVAAFVLVIVVARFGFAHPEYSPGNLVDSFWSGVDRVTVLVLHPFWPGSVPAPGVVGRWIIAGVLVLGYRQLEGMALRRQAPELDLSAIGRGRPARHGRGRSGRCPSHWPDDGLTAGERRSELAAELRFRLPSMEVRSPSILPGGARTNALASIAETSGVSGAGMAGAIVRFAGMFWPGPRRFRVRCWVESAPGTLITVLLEDVRTGLPVATKTVAGDSFHVAASMVAGYIAREIFSMDPTVPEWCFGVAGGRDLGAMQLVRLQRFHAACPEKVQESRKEQIDILSGETGTIRTAGIVRYELAQLLALDGQYPESLRLHALNRELHPRFHRGRYRLAMSLEMITNAEYCLPPGTAAARELAEILEIISQWRPDDRELRLYRGKLQDDPDRCVTGPSGGKKAWREPRITRKLLEIAQEELREVRAQLNLGRVMWDAFFRRNERAVWLPHRKRRYRKSFQDGVCVAELLVAIRCRLCQTASEEPGQLKEARVPWHLRRAIRITRRIVRDPACIHAALTSPHCHWWEQVTPKPEQEPDPPEHEQEPAAESPSRRRRSSPSWQAAYNTACLYAAMAGAARGQAPNHIKSDLESQVIASLRCVVDNPDSELERAWDWFSGDPDFLFMGSDPAAFPTFAKFLKELKLQEYPATTLGKCCPLPHLRPARQPQAAAAARPGNPEPAIFSTALDPSPKAAIPTAPASRPKEADQTALPRRRQVP